MQHKLNLIEIALNPQDGGAININGRPANYQSLLLLVINREPLQGRDAAFRVQIGKLGKLIGQAQGALTLDKADYDFLKQLADNTDCLNAALWQSLTEFIDGAEVLKEDAPPAAKKVLEA
jgi:hypothetical protein